LDSGIREAGGQDLRIRVGSKKFDPSHSGLDHAIDGIVTPAA
jgi:hypothetical protein